MRLDERGALLYPNETGPYEPKVRGKADDNGEDDDEEVLVEEPPVPRIDLMQVPAEDLEQAELF